MCGAVGGQLVPWTAANHGAWKIRSYLTAFIALDMETAARNLLTQSRLDTTEDTDLTAP